MNWRYWKKLPRCELFLLRVRNQGHFFGLLQIFRGFEAVLRSQTKSRIFLLSQKTFCKRFEAYEKMYSSTYFYLGYHSNNTWHPRGGGSAKCNVRVNCIGGGRKVKNCHVIRILPWLTNCRVLLELPGSSCGCFRPW